jgi:hypothetical protein
MLVNPLATVAEFSGTPAQTTHGFGVTAERLWPGFRVGTEVSVCRVLWPIRREESGWSGACWKRGAR